MACIKLTLLCVGLVAIAFLVGSGESQPNPDVGGNPPGGNPSGGELPGGNPPGGDLPGGNPPGGNPRGTPEVECPKEDVPDVGLPKDCTAIFEGGIKESGVYSIFPRGRPKFCKMPLEVYCDMDTDGGGWTVIQRRGDFPTPSDYFFKDWNEYKEGFGKVTEEFWLGNDNIHFLSNQAEYSIRFDLTDAEGKVGTANYKTFKLEDEQSDYTLRIDGYSGNVGDAMARHNGLKFYTKDRDNAKKCAKSRSGAWWYENCTDSNLNGKRQPGVDSAEGIQWNKWRQNKSLAAVEIKIRSNPKE